ncbi:hypothetical protein Drorol1_Dr00010509 [Drosera rotundifolia]
MIVVCDAEKKGSNCCCSSSQSHYLASSPENRSPLPNSHPFCIQFPVQILIKLDADLTSAISLCAPDFPRFPLIFHLISSSIPLVKIWIHLNHLHPSSSSAKNSKALALKERANF